VDLLSLDEIKTEMQALAANYSSGLPGTVIRASTLGDCEIDEVASALGVSFPNSFREMLLKWDFGRLDVGNVWFGQQGSYCEYLVSRNCPTTSPPWWGEGKRPEQLVLVGTTDAYIVLLDTDDGTIRACPRTAHWSDGILVANTFELLVRGAGTAFLLGRETDDEEGLGEEIASRCGADPHSEFWQDIAQGFG
jgi:hypothetical protein